MMNSKKARTEKWLELCDRIERMDDNIPTCTKKLAEWENEYYQLESDIYDILEDGVDRDYAARITELGLV